MSWLTEKNFWSASKKWFDNIWKHSKNCNLSKYGYGTGCLLGYDGFKNNYKMIAIDLSKQQALNDDTKVIHQINFNVNLDRGGQTAMYFITEEAKETILDFPQRTVRIL